MMIIMEHTIFIDDKKIFMKEYTVRATGNQAATLITTIPKIVFMRAARKHGLTYKEALKKLVASWKFDSFEGLYLTFELKNRE